MGEEVGVPPWAQAWHWVAGSRCAHLSALSQPFQPVPKWRQLSPSGPTSIGQWGRQPSAARLPACSGGELRLVLHPAPQSGSHTWHGQTWPTALPDSIWLMMGWTRRQVASLESDLSSSCTWVRGEAGFGGHLVGDPGPGFCQLSSPNHGGSPSEGPWATGPPHTDSGTSTCRCPFSEGVNTGWVPDRWTDGWRVG